MLKQICSVIALAVILTACDTPTPQPTNVSLTIEPVVGGLPLNRGETYADFRGRGLRIDDLKLLLSDLSLIQENGDTLSLSETVFFNLMAPLTIYEDRDSSLTATFEIEPGTYQGMIWGNGVPTSRNNSDPAVYELSHPLGIATGMHWTWQSGYRFLSLDGRVDTADNQQGAPTKGVSYHTGFNELYRTVSFTEAADGFTIEAGETVDFVIQFEILDLFTDGTKIMDLAEEFTTPHSVSSQDTSAYSTAVFVTDNLANRALTKKPF